MSTVTEARLRPAETNGTVTKTTTRPPVGHPVALAAVLVGALVTWYLANWGAQRNTLKFMDLYVYRLGVQAWLDGHNVYGQLPATPAGNHLPFIYPPFATVPFTPMAWLPWQTVWLISTVMSLLALAFVIYLVARRVWPTGDRQGAMLATAVLLPASLVLQPITDTLLFGQVNILLMALVVADLLVENPRWPRGVLIGVAAAIKLTPAGFILIFLLRKDFRSAANTVLGAAIATAIGFAVNWSGSVQFWFGDTGLSRAADTVYANNQTIRAALGRTGLPHALQSGLWMLLAALVAGLVVIGIRRALRSGESDATAMAMVLTSALLLCASPTAWGHHWVWVAPALVVMLGRAFRSVGWAVAFLATAVVFWIRPFAQPPKSLHLPVFWWHPFASPPQLDGKNTQQHWTLAEHLYGNLYVLLTVTLVAAFALRPKRAGEKVTESTNHAGEHVGELAHN